MVVIAAVISTGAACLHIPGDDPIGDPYWDKEPLQWTPDGKTIIAGIAGTIYRIGVDRVELTPIHQYSSLEGAHSPSLSPSEPKIVYSRKVTEKEAPGWPRRMLFISDLDGSNETLVNEEVYDARAPVWSPDGTTIAFKQFNSQMLATIAPDGSNLRTLAKEVIFANETLPVWSPDSNHIAFVGTPAEEDGRSRTRHVYTVSKDGTGLTKVGENAATAPGWSPDGKTVVYGEVDKGAPHEKNSVVIHRVARDGSQKEELFRSARANPPLLPKEETTWVPSTKEILFSGRFIATLNTESRTLSWYEAKIAVPADRLDFTRAAASPDGTRLATVAATSIGPKHLIIMDMDGSNKRSLATWDTRTLGARASNEVWVPEAPFSWVWTPVPPTDDRQPPATIAGNAEESS